MMPSVHSRLDPRQISEGFLMQTLLAARSPLEPLRDLAKALDDISEDLGRQFHRQGNIIHSPQVEDCSRIIR